jgi:hypothetical protein
MCAWNSKTCISVKMSNSFAYFTIKILYTVSEKVKLHNAPYD